VDVMTVMHLGQMVETAGLQHKPCLLLALLLEGMKSVDQQSDSRDG